MDKKENKTMKVRIKSPLEGKTAKEKLNWIKGAIIFLLLPLMIPIGIGLTLLPRWLGILLALLIAGGVFLLAHVEVKEDGKNNG